MLLLGVPVHKKMHNQKKIILLHIKNTFNTDEKKITIVHSHGNSCDLGVTFPFLIDLSTQLKSDVISYDYTGYGRSEGHPTEKDLYTDIEQVMDFGLMYLRLKLEQIILYTY